MIVLAVFSGQSPQARAADTKTNRRDHSQRKFLLHEGNHQSNGKATPCLQEDVCKSDIRQGLESKLYKEHLLTIKKKK